MARLVLETELCYIIFTPGHYMYIGVPCLFLSDFTSAKTFAIFNILPFVGTPLPLPLKTDLHLNTFNIVLKSNFNLYMILNA